MNNITKPETGCRHLSRKNWREYCVTCGLWAGYPDLRCHIDDLPNRPVIATIQPRTTRRGKKGQASSRRNRQIEKMVREGKASSYIAYRSVNDACNVAGVP